jgi:hypothetical protein
MEKYFWSLDVSTTNVGSALWDIRGKLIELKHLELISDKDCLVEHRDICKAGIFREYCEKYKEYLKNNLNGEIIKIFIEAPLQNTPVNINTTALLLGFNGMARLVLHDVFNQMPDAISVYEIRKSFLRELVTKKTVKGEIKETLSFPEEYRDKKKLYIWEKVVKLEPQIEWFYNKKGKLKDTNFDMTDAYACGIAGLKLLSILN